VITTLRNDPFLDYPAKYGKLKGGWMAWQQIKVAHARQGVYTCASSLSDAFKEKYRLNLPFVRNGVDVAYFHPASPERKATLRREMNLSEDALLMISVGGLLTRKDHLTSIRGWRLSGLKIRFIILGEGPERDTLKKVAGGHSDLQMPGQVGNVRDYLQAADFFLSASLGEGLPNTVLEAMACGLPVILSDIPPHRECLEGLDQSCLFPPGDAEALAQQLHDLTGSLDEDIHRKMRLQGEAFSAEKMSETYQEIYRKRLNVK
jgi:glycosyltransferase involved in cell wall biosynthesis